MRSTSTEPRRLSRSSYRPRRAVAVVALSTVVSVAAGSWAGTPGAAASAGAKSSSARGKPQATAKAAGKSTPKPASPSTAVTSVTPARPGGRLVVGVDQDPSELDPTGNMLTFTAFSTANAIYDPLFRVAFGQPPEPWLAESITEAPDRLSWSLKVRSGVTFHDGTALDAAAVVKNLERQKASLINGNRLSVVTAVTATDAMTVKITVAKPYVAMAHLLSGNIGLMVSPSVLAKRGDIKRDPTGAGTGPYLFKEWAPGDHLTFVKNPAYWGKQKPLLDELVYKVVPDEPSRLRALKAGDLNAMTSVLDRSVIEARAAGLSVTVPPFAGYGVVFLNNAKPPFDDVRVRRALALSIDSEALAKFLGDPNYAKRGLGLWPQNSPWYSPPRTNIAYNVKEAKALLAAYAKDKKLKGPVTFGYLAASTGQSATDVTKLLTKYWKDAGFDVQLTLQPDANQIVINVFFGNYDAANFITALTDDPDPTAYPVLHSSSSFNFAKYKNADMDAALDTGRSNPDPAVRRKAYATVQELFRRDIPFLVGSPSTVSILSTKAVCGIDGSGFFPAKTAGLC